MAARVANGAFNASATHFRKRKPFLDNKDEVRTDVHQRSTKRVATVAGQGHRDTTRRKTAKTAVTRIGDTDADADAVLRSVNSLGVFVFGTGDMAGELGLGPRKKEVARASRSYTRPACCR